MKTQLIGSLRPLIGLLAALALGSSGLAQTTGLPTLAEFSREANVTLGLAQSQILDVRVVGALGEDIMAIVNVPGSQPAYLHLSPHSVRADGFKVLEQREDGSFVQVPAGPVRTYRGAVAGAPGSTVAVSWMDEGLQGLIILGDGSELWIQPLSRVVAGAAPELHVFYGSDDIVATAARCGVEGLTSEFVGPQAAPEAATNAELALDADYAYYQDHGGSTQAQMESVINTVNAQYNSQVSISHTITTVVIRTNRRSNPYKGKSANKLLNTVQDEWNSAPLVNEPRDAVELFTGISLAGGTIGIAYVGVVCNLPYAYSVVESDFNNNFGCATDLSAHELGHNWGAGHCSCPSNTMNAYITCANSFSSASINAILSYAASQSCF